MKKAALDAIKYVLDRACTERRVLSEQEQEELDTEKGKPRDPGLGHYLCPHSEAWSRLVAAEAELLGVDPGEHEQHRQDLWYGRGDPEAPYRGLDEPCENEWVSALGYKWATDGYLAMRADAPRPPKARGFHWFIAHRADGLEGVIPLRGLCTPESPSGFGLPKGELLRRLDAVRADGALLWSRPAGVKHPVIAVFRDGESIPFVLCMPRRSEP